MVPNFPTALTWLRIVLIPVFVGVYYVPDEWLSPVLHNWIGMGVFALAAITDWLDGYLARRWGQTSLFGAFLDPVADKLMVAVALVLLVSQPPPEMRWPKFDPHVLITLTAAVIVGREITISALREWMAEMGARGKVAVSAVGKLKTIFQMTGLSMMLFRSDVWFIPAFELGVFCLVAAAALTLWSMIVYLRAAWPELMRSGNH
jgi:CDP-diacylglycerol--glycerol-3-phosphate 3-phosphatidyltransferase/cardiolipin synthase